MKEKIDDGLMNAFLDANNKMDDLSFNEFKLSVGTISTFLSLDSSDSRKGESVLILIRSFDLDKIKNFITIYHVMYNNSVFRSNLGDLCSKLTYEVEGELMNLEYIVNTMYSSLKKEIDSLNSEIDELSNNLQDRESTLESINLL